MVTEFIEPVIKLLGMSALSLLEKDISYKYY